MFWRVFWLFAAENKTCVLAVLAEDHSLFWQGDQPLPSQEQRRRLTRKRKETSNFVRPFYLQRSNSHGSRLRLPSKEKNLLLFIEALRSVSLLSTNCFLPYLILNFTNNLHIPINLHTFFSPSVSRTIFRFHGRDATESLCNWKLCIHDLYPVNSAT